MCPICNKKLRFHEDEAECEDDHRFWVLDPDHKRLEFRAFNVKDLKLAGKEFVIN